MYKLIDMQNDPRRAQYELFCSYSNPSVGLTAKVDVTDLVRFCRERHFSFYAAMVRVVTLAANRVPELRRRKSGDEVHEYGSCSASMTELGENGVYYYCTLEPKQSWGEFIPYAEATRAARRACPTLTEDADAESQFFITSVPWVSYEQLLLPYDAAIISNPSISWGRYEADHRDRLMLPLTLICHHGLVDGVHIGTFYRYVAEELANLPELQ